MVNYKKDKMARDGEDLVKRKPRRKAGSTRLSIYRTAHHTDVWHSPEEYIAPLQMSNYSNSNVPLRIWSIKTDACAATFGEIFEASSSVAIAFGRSPIP